ncbi:hypothetical protein FOZ60_001194 [Perkinsus olseni]|nr:hypothetical protein FOZ60_001194 [Perkinsus olseni]
MLLPVSVAIFTTLLAGSTDAAQPIPPGQYCVMQPISNYGFFGNSNTSRAACLKFTYASPRRATLEYKSADGFGVYLRYDEVIINGESLTLKRRGSTEGPDVFPYIKTKFRLTVPADPNFRGFVLHRDDGAPPLALSAGGCTRPPGTESFCGDNSLRALEEEDAFGDFYPGENDFGDFYPGQDDFGGRFSGDGGFGFPGFGPVFDTAYYLGKSDATDAGDTIYMYADDRDRKGGVTFHDTRIGSVKYDIGYSEPLLNYDSEGGNIMWFDSPHFDSMQEYFELQGEFTYDEISDIMIYYPYSAAAPLHFLERDLRG